ncbi:MAG: flagellar biosynthesis protein FlhF [Salinibacter sp.]
MTVKTLTGTSIQDALAKARSELGDDVVLMESTPATTDAPAKIAVMIDASAADMAPQAPTKGQVPKPPGADSDGTLPVPDTDGDSTDSDTVESQTAGFGYGNADGEAPSPNDETSQAAPVDDPNFSDLLEREQETGRGRIFPVSDDSEAAPDTEVPDRSPPPDRSSFAKRKKSSRSDRPGHSERWSAHPLYGVLLEKGLRPETADRLFDELSERGVDLTNNPPEDLRWACAQLLCQCLEVAEPGWGQKTLALIGPGGAGKTSLILKLATHNQLLGSGEPVVLHLQPEPDRTTAYQNPVDLYRQFGIPVQHVRTEEEMAQALNRAESFGRVLIDTPPLPLPLSESRSALRRLEYLLRPVHPLDVHFVLSATRAFNSLDATALPHLPVRPNAVSLTHLDEAPTWGRMVEWLFTLDLPVQFVSEGPQVPDDVQAFSLQWFVEDVMDL